MKNVGLREDDESLLLDLNDAPLFRQNVAPQTDNAVPQISNLISLEIPNVEPHKMPGASVADLFWTNATPAATENVEPRSGENVELHQETKATSLQKENVELRQKKNVEPQKLTKPVRGKKPGRKSPAKKIRSQKRSVIALKFFVTSAEKVELENAVRNSGCSLSNYIRLNIGLAPNESGRKKRNVEAAFDVNDLDLED